MVYFSVCTRVSVGVGIKVCLSYSIFYPPIRSDRRTYKQPRGCSGGVKVLGKLPVPGRPTNLDYSRARAYCACSKCGGELFGQFSLIYHLSFLSPSLWETIRYRLKYCLKGPLHNQPTNQPTNKQTIHPSVARLFVCPFIHLHKLP